MIDRLIGLESVLSFGRLGLLGCWRSGCFSFCGCFAGCRVRCWGLESNVSLSLRRLPCRAPGILVGQSYRGLLEVEMIVLSVQDDGGLEG